jgi:hypothetical protein
MMLSAVVAAYFDVLPLGIVLDESQVTRSLKRAVRFYCGYATLTNAPSDAEIALAALPPESLLPPCAPYRLGDAAIALQIRLDAVAGKDVHTPISADNSIDDDQDFDLTPSELSIISPLFYLYCELENSQAIAASRANGFEAWGRDPSEVQLNILEEERAIPGKAFIEEVYTI